MSNIADGILDNTAKIGIFQKPLKACQKPSADTSMNPPKVAHTRHGKGTQLGIVSFADLFQ